MSYRALEHCKARSLTDLWEKRYYEFGIVKNKAQTGEKNNSGLLQFRTQLPANFINVLVLGKKVRTLTKFTKGLTRNIPHGTIPT